MCFLTFLISFITSFPVSCLLHSSARLALAFKTVVKTVGNLEHLGASQPSLCWCSTLWSDNQPPLVWNVEFTEVVCSLIYILGVFAFLFLFSTEKWDLFVKMQNCGHNRRYVLTNVKFDFWFLHCAMNDWQWINTALVQIIFREWLMFYFKVN